MWFTDLWVISANWQINHLTILSILFSPQRGVIAYDESPITIYYSMEFLYFYQFMASTFISSMNVSCHLIL